MAALTLAGMSPLRIGSTTLPVNDLAFSPDIQAPNFKHSGNEFASVGVVPTAKPMCSFKTPLLGAYNLIGLKMLQVSTFSVYFSTFLAGIKQGGANADILALAGSATAALWIDSCAPVGENQIAMASVQVALLSADGAAHPFSPIASGATLPTLGSEPQLHTMGPVAVETTKMAGATDVGFQQHCQVYIPTNDGDSFPRTAAWEGADPELMCDHEDAINALTTLGLMGKNIVTSLGIFFVGIDPTTQLRQTTGLSLTATSGRIIPGPVQFDLQKPPRLGIRCKSLSSSTTHPWTVNTAATIPTG